MSGQGSCGHGSTLRIRFRKPKVAQIVMPGAGHGLDAKA